MKSARLIALVLLPLALSGCLEVKQHPAWIKGQYAGKEDNLPFQRLFHGDRLAWFAAVSNRNSKQNEYNRANP
jgi:hypothetical protein